MTTTVVSSTLLRTPLVDDRGHVTRDWYLLFLKLFRLTGGENDTMGVVYRGLVDARFVASGVAVQYTAPSLTRTVLDASVAANNGGAPVTLAVHLVPAGGSASLANRLLSRAIAAGAVDLLPELAGQTLNPGDQLMTSATLDASVVLRVSGREIS